MNIEKMENRDLEENKTILDEEAAMKEKSLKKKRYKFYSTLCSLILV